MRDSLDKVFMPTLITRIKGHSMPNNLIQATEYTKQLFPDRDIQVNEVEKQILIIFDSLDEIEDSNINLLVGKYNVLHIQEQTTGAFKYAISLPEINQKELSFLENAVSELESSTTPRFT